MAKLDPRAFSAIVDFFGQQGVPTAIPLMIGYMESGLDPDSSSDWEPSHGIFQAYIGTPGYAGMGYGYTPAQLRDPVFNVQLVGPAIVDAFNGMGGMQAWNALQNNEAGQRAFIEQIHQEALRPDAGARASNYANNWSTGLQAVSDVWDTVRPPAAGVTGGGATAPPTQWPASSYYSQFAITSGFGDPYPLDSSYTDPNTGQYYEHFNKGFDFDMDYNTPVQAVVPGTVTHVGDDGQGWGYRVVVQDAAGNYHSYGHVGNATVGVGDTVQSGQVLATVQPGGTSSGPHLSYDVYRQHQNGGWEYLPPQQFLNGTSGPFTPVYPGQDAYNQYAPYIDKQAAEYGQYLANLPDATSVEGMADQMWKAYTAAYQAGPMWTDGLGGRYATQEAAQAALAQGWDPAWGAVPSATRESEEEFADVMQAKLSSYMDVQSLVENADIIGAEVSVTGGGMSITYDPAKLATLPPETQAQIQRILANNGTDLVNAYRADMNALRQDEYGLVERWVANANQNITQMTDWARSRNLDANDAAAMNHQLQREYGMDLNDILQANWQNEFDFTQTGYENDQGYTDRLNELAQLRYDYQNAFEVSERERLQQEYMNKLQEFENKVTVHGLDMDKVTKDLDRWFGIKEQNESRASYITETQRALQGTAIPMGHNGSFSAEDFGGLAESMAQFAGLDPSKATLNFPTTMTIDPEGVMNRFDEEQGVGGQAPAYPDNPIGYDDIPGLPTLPGYTPFDPGSLTDPTKPPTLPTPPNLGQGWAPPPNLGIDWQVPGGMFELPNVSQWMGGPLPYQPYGGSGGSGSGAAGTVPTSNPFAGLNVPGLDGIMDMVSQYWPGGSGSFQNMPLLPGWEPDYAGNIPGQGPWPPEPVSPRYMANGGVYGQMQKKHRMYDPSNPFAGLRAG